MENQSNSHKKPLIDTFGRVHDYLRISLTDRCNFRCFYCMPEEDPGFMQHNQLMKPDEIEAIAQTFVEMGIKKIRITGGEPLVRKEAPEIIERLGQLPVELAITTNGALMHLYPETFKKAGLRAINVSLDTLRTEKFKAVTKRNQGQRVLKNIEQFIREGFHLKVNMVVNRSTNQQELLDFVEWTRNVPVHIRFIEFMPFQGNSWEWEQMVPYQEMLDMLETYYPIERLQDKPNDTSKNYRVEGFEGTFAVISSVTAPFCETCNRLRLLADGQLRNCLFSDEQVNLMEAYRQGQDIEPLILENVHHKYWQQGGKQLSQETTLQSMVSIGG